MKITLCCPLSGSCEESLDVCCPWGGGGVERTDQRTDWEKFSIGTRKQPAEEPGQPGAARTVPGASSDRLAPVVVLLLRARSAAAAARPVGPTGSTKLGTFGVAQDESSRRGRLSGSNRKGNGRKLINKHASHMLDWWNLHTFQNLTNVVLRRFTHRWQSSWLRLGRWQNPQNVIVRWKKNNRSGHDIKNHCACV